MGKDENKYKVELRTTFETGLITLCALLFSLTAVFFRMSFWGHYSSPPLTSLKPVAFLFLGLTVAAFVAIKATDCYYVIEPAERVIMHRFKCLFYCYEEVLMRFEDIDCLTVTGRFHQDRQRLKYYGYKIVLMTKKPKMVDFSDETFGEEGRLAANELAKELASVMNVTFVPCGPNQIVIIDRKSGQYGHATGNEPDSEEVQAEKGGLAILLFTTLVVIIFVCFMIKTISF